MHSGKGLTPENSLRTASLALNAQSRQKLSFTHADAGALYIDESSQLPAELNQRRCAQPIHAKRSTASIEACILARAKDTGEWLASAVLAGPPTAATST